MTSQELTVQLVAWIAWPLSLVLSVLLLSLASVARAKVLSRRHEIETNRLLGKILEAITELRQGQTGGVQRAEPSQLNGGQNETTQAHLVQRYLTWIDAEMQLNSRYHDHKELMAWTATAVYVPGIVLFAGYAAKYLHEVHPDVYAIRLSLAILLGFGGLMLAMFVNMQFERRWVATDWERGFRRVRSLVSDKIHLANFETGVREAAGMDRQPWPAFIGQELERCSKPRWATFRDSLPHVLVPWEWASIDGRIRTELPSYVALAIGTTIAIVLLWL